MSVEPRPPIPAAPPPGIGAADVPPSAEPTPSPRSSLRARSALLDNARAISMIMIVMVHAPGMFFLVLPFSSFRIPLFFFIAGIVTRHRQLAEPPTARLAGLAVKYVIPYVFFFAISYVYWLVAKRHGLRRDEFEHLPWWDPIVAFIVGNGEGLYVNVVLWFFPCLFIVSAAYYLLRTKVGALTRRLPL